MSDDMPDGDKRMSPAKAAEVASVSRGTIQNAIRSGKLKAFRSNKGWLIEPDDLQSWMLGRVTDDLPLAMPVSTPMISEEILSVKLENADLKAKLLAQERLILRLETELEYAKRPLWKRIFG